MTPLVAAYGIAVVSTAWGFWCWWMWGVAQRQALRLRGELGEAQAPGELYFKWWLSAQKELDGTKAQRLAALSHANAINRQNAAIRRKEKETGK